MLTDRNAIPCWVSSSGDSCSSSDDSRLKRRASYRGRSVTGAGSPVGQATDQSGSSLIVGLQCMTANRCGPKQCRSTWRTSARLGSELSSSRVQVSVCLESRGLHEGSGISPPILRLQAIVIWAVRILPKLNVVKAQKPKRAASACPTESCEFLSPDQRSGLGEASTCKPVRPLLTHD